MCTSPKDLNYPEQERKIAHFLGLWVEYFIMMYDMPSKAWCTFTILLFQKTVSLKDVRFLGKWKSVEVQY